MIIQEIYSVLYKIFNILLINETVHFSFFLNTQIEPPQYDPRVSLLNARNSDRAPKKLLAVKNKIKVH